MNNIKPITMENVFSELEGITAIVDFIVNDLGNECACLDGAATQAYLAKRVNLLYAPALYHIFDSLAGLRDRVGGAVKRESRNLLRTPARDPAQSWQREVSVFRPYAGTQSGKAADPARL